MYTFFLTFLKLFLLYSICSTFLLPPQTSNLDILKSLYRIIFCSFYYLYFVTLLSFSPVHPFFFSCILSTVFHFNLLRFLLLFLLPSQFAILGTFSSFLLLYPCSNYCLVLVQQFTVQINVCNFSSLNVVYLHFWIILYILDPFILTTSRILHLLNFFAPFMHFQLRINYYKDLG